MKRTELVALRDKCAAARDLLPELLVGRGGACYEHVESEVQPIELTRLADEIGEARELTDELLEALNAELSERAQRGGANDADC